MPRSSLDGDGHGLPGRATGLDRHFSRRARTARRLESAAVRPARSAERAARLRTGAPGVSGLDRLDDGTWNSASSVCSHKAGRSRRGRDLDPEDERRLQQWLVARQLDHRPVERDARAICARQSAAGAASSSTRAVVEWPTSLAFSAASPAASSSRTAWTGNTGSSGESSTARTRAPRNGSDRRGAGARDRGAPRARAPGSCRARVPAASRTRRSPGSSSPRRIRSRRRPRPAHGERSA